jgi:REP element-mobilizing transposase RayT
VHVVLRTLPSIPRLRTGHAFQAVRGALRAVGARVGFRVVHTSIQHNHLHFLVEADDRQTLSRGMQALAISVARRINKRAKRTGKLFAFRYHATAITTPRQTRNALAYVLLNARHHAAARGEPLSRALDACSSSPCFEGWTSPRPPTRGLWSDTVSPASTWRLQTGWRRHGLVDPFAVP